MKVNSVTDVLSQAVEACQTSIPRVEALERRIDESTMREVALNAKVTAVRDDLAYIRKKQSTSLDPCCQSVVLAACDRIEAALGEHPLCQTPDPALKAICEALEIDDIEAALDRIAWMNGRIEQLEKAEMALIEVRAALKTHDGSDIVRDEEPNEYLVDPPRPARYELLFEGSDGTNTRSCRPDDLRRVLVTDYGFETNEASYIATFVDGVPIGQEFFRGALTVNVMEGPPIETWQYDLYGVGSRTGHSTHIGGKVNQSWSELNTSLHNLVGGPSAARILWAVRNVVEDRTLGPFDRWPVEEDAEGYKVQVHPDALDSEYLKKD